MLQILKAVFGAGSAALVGPAQAVRMINDGAIVIDVREPAEFSAGHIPSAINVPLSALQQNGPRAIAMAGLGSAGKPILVICRSGARSAVACGLLESSIPSKPLNVRGGMLAWQASGLPVSR